MIDTSIAVHFYDDRSKDNTVLELNQILYQDDTVCFCKANSVNSENPADNTILVYILFDLETGKVLISEYNFWIATNDAGFIQDILEGEA